MPALFWILVSSGALIGSATTVVVSHTWGALDDTIETTGQVAQKTSNLAAWLVAGGALYLGGKYAGLIK